MNAQRRFALGLAGVVFILLSAQAISAQSFSLEQVLSSPFPSDLIASKSGDKLGWVFDHLGKRNLWVAEAPAFKGRQLTRYDKDDGQEITEPVFSPDGGWVAYVRGGPPNSEKEIPNPTSDPLGARQEVWLVNVRTGATVRIGEGSSPSFSPRGDRVIFEREDHLWASTVPVGATRLAGPPKKMFEIRGEVGSATWSPDGSSLAFVSSRGDHSFIAIYEPASSRIRFLEPSVDRDIEPRWSPDGRRIAYVRLFNVVDTLTADKERLLPWSIRVVDVASGVGKEIWKSGGGEMDSYSRLPMGENQLQWAAGDRIVFASEKDGWAHLYSISSSGGQPVTLTPGNYEVENVAWAPDRSFMIVSSNAGAINYRHLWKVNVTRGEPRQITEGATIEMYPMIASGGRQVAFMHATPTHPFLPYITSLKSSGKEPIEGTQPLAPQALPSDFPATQLVEPEQVTFKASDGTQIHGQLFKPKVAGGRAPGVVFMHGGPIRQMLPTWHYSYYYHNSYAFNQYLASRGYVVLSVNYRSGIGYGRAFREAQHRGPRGASEYQDIVAAGKYLRSRSDVDGKRIGLWGGSYGGYLTAMGLARDSDLFAAGVDVHGVHDWSKRVGPSPWATGDLAKLGRESSPISSVDKWKSPVLLIHGDDDRNVAFNQTVELVRKLRERGVEFEELIFPDDVHDFLRHENWLRAYRAAVDFFDRYLKAAGERSAK
ncbi:MAG TPA: prolyl oligopeptidase family serine peptidase [Blastocatellia bacterium]|nr:prolyl oligopeptidase family serine peptidase [Blastocatellia bacterium]